jgi:DNA-binding PadR family transcriptional regulator
MGTLDILISLGWPEARCMVSGLRITCIKLGYSAREEGSYPACIDWNQGLIESEWAFENNRRARFYKLTPCGRAISVEASNWRRTVDAVNQVIDPLVRMLRQIWIDLCSRVGLFGRRALKDRAREEMEFHLTMREQQLMDLGVPAEEHAAECREFGTGCSRSRDGFMEVFSRGEILQDIRTTATPRAP